MLHAKKNWTLLVLPLLSLSSRLHGQSNPAPAPAWNWQALAALPAVRPAELQWLRDKLSAQEQQEVLGLVSALSQPAVCQLLPASFYLDGTATQPGIKPSLDSLGRFYQQD